MTRANAALSNFVGGELSALVHGRSDLPVFKRGVERAENFILLPQGPAQFRPGFRRVHSTRLNKMAALITFQFNDEQTYQIEATEGYFRFYKDEGIITETPYNVTAVTTGATTVVTTGQATANGSEVFLDGLGGVTGLNGKSYLTKNASGNQFEITDIDGNAINTNGQVYTSGGTVAKIYEIRTPYRESDIEFLQFSQNTDTMYVDHQAFEPRKLTRTGHANWSLARYTRTNDPFGTAKALTGITAANPAVFTSAAHGLAVGNKVYIDSVVGMTQVNFRHFTVDTVPTANTFTVKDENGVALNSSAYTAYSSGGFVERIEGPNNPRAVTFTADSRVLHGGTDSKPESIFGSRAPTESSGVRYDDFTTGTLATDATIFTLAPVDGQVSVIQWLSNTDKFIVAGTFSNLRRIYGGTEQEAITPTGINAKPVNGFGSALASPVSLGNNLFYIQRGMQGLRSLEYDYASDGYLTTDRNLVADHLPYPGLKQLTFQQGKPDLLWATRTDGLLLGLTYKDKEDISGWHRHHLGGSHRSDAGTVRPFGRVRWASTMARPSAQDQLWIVAERLVGSTVRRSVEFMTDAPVYPAFLDFFTGDEEGDTRRFINKLYETQRLAIHLDSSLTYDGRSYGRTANANLTVGASTITSSANVFTSSMVGREIWGAYDENGQGGGRAVITAYNSATSVNVNITVPFEKSLYNANNWYLTTSTVSGLDHLEGESVGVVADGGPDNDAVVVNGTVSTTAQASVVTVGYKYRGIMKTLNIDLGGVTGSAQSKPRNCYQTKIRFLNSINCKFGTNPYQLSSIEFRQAQDLMDEPIPVFSGFQDVPYFDDTEDDKSVYVVQDAASPCTVTVLDLYMETTDE